jgi:hypothetical protein
MMILMHKKVHNKVGDSYIEDHKPWLAIAVWIALGWLPGPSPS